MAQPIVIKGMSGESAQQLLEAVSRRLPRITGELGHVTATELFALATWLLTSVFLVLPELVQHLDAVLAFFTEVNADLLIEAGVDVSKTMAIMVPHFTFPEGDAVAVDSSKKETVH